MRRLTFSFFLSVLCLSPCLLPANASACIEVDGIPDFNCDGSVKIAVLGDSIVRGFGDTENRHKGGYVLRASQSFPEVTMFNLGFSALKTDGLLLILEEAFDYGTNEEVRVALTSADIVVLDVGRNDRAAQIEPKETFNRLGRAANKIRKRVRQATGVEPMVVTAALMIPTRGKLGPWVKELNKYILRSNTTAHPADLRFDRVSSGLLLPDKLHPSSKGYQKLAQTFVTYLKNKLARKMRALRVDSDGDGIPDALMGTVAVTPTATPTPIPTLEPTPEPTPDPITEPESTNIPPPSSEPANPSGNLVPLQLSESQGLGGEGRAGGKSK